MAWHAVRNKKTESAVGLGVLLQSDRYLYARTNQVPVGHVENKHPVAVRRALLHTICL